MIFFNNEYMGKKVLVTGHTGFKGAWLSIWLHKLGARVIGYSLEPPTEPSLFKICSLDEKVNSIIGDIRNEENLLKTFDEYKPDIVFHLAAQPLVRYSYLAPKETYETNILGTVNVLEAARKTSSVKTIIVVTTDKCYENKEWIYGYRETDTIGGFDPYSSSKGCVELIVSAYRNSYFNHADIEIASARAGNVIAGGDWADDRLIPDFVKAVITNRDMVVRNPEAVRPWQHVLEPLSGYLWLGALMLRHKSKYDSSWNFGPMEGDVLNVNDILKLAITEWGRGHVEINDSLQPHEANQLRLDISKARTYLEWHPVFDTTMAIELSIKWYKTYYENKNQDMYEYTLSQINEYERQAGIQNLKWC